VAKVDGAYNDAMRAAPPHPSNSLGLERLVFFSDAVIAIGITLLAIDLRLPHTPGLTNHGLLGLLRDMVPRFVAFVISFAVIGVYWAAHHRMFRFIAAFDQGLILLNLLFLFFVALLPFLTSVVGEHGNLSLATAIYAAGLATMGFSSSLLWVYAVRHRLVAATVTPALARYLTWRGLTVPIVFLLSIPLVFISPVLAQLSWVSVMPVQRLLARRARISHSV
jgi:uncharacterized membrane protein